MNDELRATGQERKQRIRYADFLALRQPPSLFIYGEDQDFSNGWIYHHWAQLGDNAGSAIWGV